MKTGIAYPAGNGRLVEKLSYAVGDFSFCLAWNGVSAFLFASWLKCGISAATIGGLVFAGQFLTVAANLAVGAISDRRCRHGYRLWVRRSAIPIAILLFAVFTVPRLLTGFVQTAAAAVCYVLFLIVYSCGSIPFSSLLKTMTGDADVRVSFGSWRMTGAFLGAFAVTTAFPVLSAALPQPMAVGMVAVVLCLGLWLASSFVVERNCTNDVICGGFFNGSFWRKLTSGSFVRLFVSAVLLRAADAIRFCALAVYAAETAATPVRCAGGFACLTLASALGAALVPALSRLIGLVRLVSVAAGLSALVQCIVFFAGGTSPGVLLMALAAVSALSGMMPTACNVLVASFAERHGDASAGRVFAVYGLTGKMGNGLGILAMSIVLICLPGSTGALVALSFVPALFLLALPFVLQWGKNG